VLLLDEPASGLDPRARIEIRNLLKRLGEMNKTVIVSSHILPELADVCTRVGMIEKGHLIVDGHVEEVMRKARERLVLHVRVRDQQSGPDDSTTGATDRAAALIEQADGVEGVSISRGTVYVTLVSEMLDYSFLPTMLIEAGFRLELFREEEVNLETAFMQLTKGLVQ
ncbi:MAG: multidrug ABC transporter ATP-binding protein, partial [Planctomycetaceae bacterium]